VGNILKKAEAGGAVVVNAGLFEVQQEETLYNELEALKSKTAPMFDAGDYEAALLQLSVLKKPIDDFFDNVMVMTDNVNVRNNRIALLSKMNTLFMRAADLSRLHQA
jgi:glycyl-tRNA synthetase beta chain